MSKYNKKELKWPLFSLNSPTNRIAYTENDVLMMVIRTSKSKEWKLYKYPKFENNEYVRGFNLVLRNTLTGAVYTRVKCVVTKFENDTEYQKALLFKIKARKSNNTGDK